MLILNNKGSIEVKRQSILKDRNDTIFRHQRQEMKLQPDNDYRIIRQNYSDPGYLYSDSIFNAPNVYIY